MILKFGKTIWLLVSLYTLVLILLILAALISVVFDVPFSMLSRDPTEILEVTPFYGTISKIGIVIWCMCGAICIFCSFLLKNKIEKALFLLASGIITMILMIDDLFLVHDYLLYRYLNLPQEIVYFVYVIMIGIYLLWFKSVILKTRFFILLIALILFGLSITVDLVPLGLLPMHFLIEDGFKMFGIVTWFAYFVNTCYWELESAQ